MENNKYNQGEKICMELFEKTGDPRYHNMMKGFKQLSKDNELEQESQREM